LFIKAVLLHSNATPSSLKAALPSMAPCGIRPPRKAEVQILHRYTDVTYQDNAGAIVEEQKSVRPSLKAAPPSMALCGIPPILGHKKGRFKTSLFVKQFFRYI